MCADSLKLYRILKVAFRQIPVLGILRFLLLQETKCHLNDGATNPCWIILCSTITKTLTSSPLIVILLLFE